MTNKKFYQKIVKPDKNSTGCYGMKIYSKFKVKNQFNRRHTRCIQRIKFIFQRKNWNKLAFRNSLSGIVFFLIYVYCLKHQYMSSMN